ncbi:hypothetical protein CAC42_6764 [Sphaceloma murrayae]|uniref:Protein CCC1 n=1 Tax=Sphaceloma murrayae TaxID=2082308 RepID=A0A2K1QH54_9PEZI|nr:hypothetical protein CAC42_6764 [Sphaceloma murrayae]
MAQKLIYYLRNALWSPHTLYAPVPQEHPHYHTPRNDHAQSMPYPCSPSLRHTSIDSGTTTTTTILDTEKGAPPPPSKPWVSPRLLSDATIGLSDGLTVPFALTAGLSALGDTRVVIYGGFAELFAGAISMGVGGYLGARGECQAYAASLASVRGDIRSHPRVVDEQIRSSLAEYGLSSSTLASVVAELKTCPDALENFLMKFHREQSDSTSSSIRAYISGLTIALGYFMGGLLPLLPYLFCEAQRHG